MRFLLLVDGSSMLATAFYGNLPRDENTEILHDRHGRPTNAILPMLRQVEKIMRVQRPDYVLFAFDKTRNTFRKDLYPDYKGNRKESPGPLREQFISIQEILRGIGFKCIQSDRYEADDLIASAAKKFQDHIQVRILTKDHDYLQMVSDSTRVWMVAKDQETADAHMGNYFMYLKPGEKPDPFIRSLLPDKTWEVTRDSCRDFFGVYPEQIPDLKGLAGDTSDNIPGIRGVSEKTAVPLLQEYGTIEGIYDSIAGMDARQIGLEWKEMFGFKRSPAGAFLKEGAKESALLSKKLATCVPDVALPYDLKDLRAEMDMDMRKQLYIDYELFSLLRTNPRQS